MGCPRYKYHSILGSRLGSLYLECHISTTRAASRERFVCGRPEGDSTGSGFRILGSGQPGPVFSKTKQRNSGCQSEVRSGFRARGPIVRVLLFRIQRLWAPNPGVRIYLTSTLHKPCTPVGSKPVDLEISTIRGPAGWCEVKRKVLALDLP